MESLIQDIKYAIRVLINNPVFTLVVVGALSLAIGVNTAVFSLINAIVIKPLPYKDPEGIVRICNQNLKSGLERTGLSPPDYADYRDSNQSLDELGAYTYDDFTLTGAGEPEQLKGSFVTASFFSVLGVTAGRGRCFSPDEDSSKSDRVVVLSHGLWRRRFGGDQELIGKTVEINNAGFTVIGIAPAEFRAPNKDDELWVPMCFDGGDHLRLPSVTTVEGLSNRGLRFLNTIARLKPGVGVNQAKDNVLAIGKNLQERYPDANAQYSVTVFPIKEEILGKIDLALTVLLAAAGFVLLIACANVASLLFARATARQKEIALRLALGVGRFRLIRQLLTESLLASLLSSILGMLLAFLGVKLLMSLDPANIPRLNEVRFDGLVLGFTLLLSLAAGVGFGLAPALRISRIDLVETLKEGSRSQAGGGHRRRTYSIIVIAEIAVAQVLLISAGLMIKSFLSLQRVDPGFKTDNVLTMQLTLSPNRYAEKPQINAFVRRLLEKTETLPGVSSVSVISTLPLTASLLVVGFEIEGRPPAGPGERLRTHYRAISPDYFRTMGIPLKKGRGFSGRDNETSTPVIIINETAANRFWPGEDPLGKRVVIRHGGMKTREIVGVVADVKHTSLDADSGLEMYSPFVQHPWSFMALAARTSLEPTRLIPSISQAVLQVDSGQPVYDVKTMEQVVSDSISQPRVNTILLALLAALALAQAAVGVYGIMNYSVSLRTQEIGIRNALGAQRKDILRLVVGGGLVLTLTGVALGVGLALGATRVISNLLYGVGPIDGVIFAATGMFLSTISFLSSYFPARRAARVDPVIALRYR